MFPPFAELKNTGGQQQPLCRLRMRLHDLCSASENSACPSRGELSARIKMPWVGQAAGFIPLSFLHHPGTVTYRWLKVTSWGKRYKCGDFRLKINSAFRKVFIQLARLCASGHASSTWKMEPSTGPSPGTAPAEGCIARASRELQGASAHSAQLMLMVLFLSSQRTEAPSSRKKKKKYLCLVSPRGY